MAGDQAVLQTAVVTYQFKSLTGGHSVELVVLANKAVKPYYASDGQQYPGHNLVTASAAHGGGGIPGGAAGFVKSSLIQGTQYILQLPPPNNMVLWAHATGGANGKSNHGIDSFGLVFVQSIGAPQPSLQIALNPAPPNAQAPFTMGTMPPTVNHNLQLVSCSPWPIP